MLLKYFCISPGGESVFSSLLMRLQISHLSMKQLKDLCCQCLLNSFCCSFSVEIRFETMSVLSGEKPIQVLNDLTFTCLLKFGARQSVLNLRELVLEVFLDS